MLVCGIIAYNPQWSSCIFILCYTHLKLALLLHYTATAKYILQALYKHYSSTKSVGANSVFLEICGCSCTHSTHANQVLVEHTCFPFPSFITIAILSDLRSLLDFLNVGKWIRKVNFWNVAIKFLFVKMTKVGFTYLIWQDEVNWQ